jgi:hypothetical protein
MAKSFDWSKYEEKPTNKSSFNWDQYAEKPEKESFLSALAQSPIRIGEDIYKGAMGAFNAIPEYYEKAKTEVPGLFNILSGGNPLQQAHALGQFGAGIGEAARGVANIPHGVSEYLSNRLHLIPEQVPQNIPQFSGQSPIEKFAGEPLYEGEKLARGIGRNLPNIGVATKIGSAIKPITKNSIKNSIIESHDLLKKKATDAMNEVEKEVKNRGISKIDINPKFIDSLKRYFPKTDASKELINRAKKGEYEDIRKLQTDLFTHAQANAKSKLEADRFKGKEASEKRDKLNKLIADHLRDTGHPDLADKLNVARKDYRMLNEIYFDPGLNRGLMNMVDSKKRKIPKNLINLLNEDSNAMSKFMSFHPGLESKVNKYGLQKNISNYLKKSAKVGLPLGAAGYIGYEVGKPHLRNNEY